MLELNQSNFETEVIRKSFEMPVLIDFWADWCAPCKMLMPVLDKLAADYPGQLQIAKVNTDVERGLAQQHGIRSLPTLHLYRNGELVEEILGAQPESTLRTLVEAYLVRASDKTLDEARTRKTRKTRVCRWNCYACTSRTVSSRRPHNSTKHYRTKCAKATRARASGCCWNLPPQRPRPPTAPR